MRSHKNWSVFLFAMFFMFSVPAFAQDAEEITDEELEMYAVLMDSVEAMKATVKGTLAEMIQNTDAMSVARYNQLNKLIGDEEKLAEAEATEEEIAFLNDLIAKKEEMEAALTQNFQTMAAEYVGVKTYKKVKAALKDKETKARYNAIYEGVVAARQTAEPGDTVIE